MKNTRFSLHSVVAMGFPFFSARLFFTFHWIFFPARQANLLDSSVFPQPTAACSHTSCRHFLEIFIFRTALFFTAEENRTLSSEVFLRCGEYSSPLAQTRRAVDISLAIFSSPFNKKRYFLQFFILICCCKKNHCISTPTARRSIYLGNLARTALNDRTHVLRVGSHSRDWLNHHHIVGRGALRHDSRAPRSSRGLVHSLPLTLPYFVRRWSLATTPHSGWEREKREIVQIIVYYVLLSCIRSTFWWELFSFINLPINIKIYFIFKPR